MTPISEKLLKEQGWLSLQYTWAKDNKILRNDNGEWKLNGRKIKYMEQIDNEKINEKRYHLSFSELIDRLQLCQLKENHGKDFAQEIKDIVHDIQLFIDSGVVVGAEMIRAIIALTQVNTFIWTNEDNARKGTPENNNLWFTHQLNANRSEIKAHMQEMIGGRTDKKLNYLEGVWKISW